MRDGPVEGSVFDQLRIHEPPVCVVHPTGGPRRTMAPDYFREVFYRRHFCVRKSQTCND